MSHQNALSRRDFLKASAAAGAALALGGTMAMPQSAFAADEKKEDKPPMFKISLAEWSLHKALFAKKVDHLDFPKIAKKDFGIEACEYVNQFFKDKAKDQAYLAEMKKRCDDLGVKSVLIMCDGEGNLGDPDENKRKTAVENHYKWADAAKFLGCHSIRVNAASSGTWDEQVVLAADGLRRLTEYCAKLGLGCIVENHGGLSSNGKWLAQVMKTVDHKSCGTLPDFGNFRIKPDEEYDRYTGVNELMPYAKGVSAKTHDFDEQGNETHTDYRKMLKIVCVEHKYRGFLGIEYEGEKIGEMEGIAATKKLLEKVREEMSKA
jgi:sugar phosphate isomerase/epimerase